MLQYPPLPYEQMTLPKVTKKQLEILLLIYRYRFIDRKQIQTFLTHKNHRRIHAWLTDLVEKDCIGGIYSKKMPENTKPTVYYLGKNGRKILVQHFRDIATTVEDGDGTTDVDIQQLTNTYKDSQRTEIFRICCLALVHIAITTQSVADAEGYNLVFASPTVCQTYSLLSKFDSYARFQKGKGKKKHYVFLYITNRTPKRFISYRIAEVIKFLTREWDYETTDPKPMVLCICSNIPIRNYTKKLIESKLEYYRPDEPLNFGLTTLSEYKAHSFSPQHWKHPTIKEDW